MGLIDSIKKEAKGNRTKIQSTDALTLERILNNTFFLEKKIEEESRFVKQVITRGFDSQERVGLHASAMLKSDKEFCIRAQVLSLIYKQLQGDQIPVGLARIFEQGNAIHEKWQRLLIRAGYGAPEDMDRTRICEEYKISYTPDIDCLIPKFFEGRMIGEIKSVNTYQFQKMSAHPSAWKQCQWYTHLCREELIKKNEWNGIDYTKGFVLSEDKNTQDFKIEIYDYSLEKVTPFIQRSEEIMYYYNRVFDEGRMVSRPTDAKSPSSKRCSTCVMREACWNIGKGRVKLEDKED